MGMTASQRWEMAENHRHEEEMAMIDKMDRFDQPYGCNPYGGGPQPGYPQMGYQPTCGGGGYGNEIHHHHHHHTGGPRC
jgi:hypothetical protein